jgi:hypothetical protein
MFYVFESDRLAADEGSAHLGYCAIEVDDVQTFADVREQLLALSRADWIVIDFGECASRGASIVGVTALGRKQRPLSE